MTYHLILGNQAYSSWSLRGWLLFKPFGIDFTYEVVPLRTPAFEQFERDNYPSLTVPTLQLQQGAEMTPVWDSLAIAELLHEQHPDAGLWPDDIVARAAARSLTAEMHSGFMDMRGTMDCNFRRQYKSFVPSAEAQHDIDRIVALWSWAQSKWGGSGPYLFGEKFHVVDAFFTPVASRFHTYGIRLNDQAQAYVDALLNHPATLEFCQAGEKEDWIIPEYEMDIE
jgi:glutathione S-transferase